MQLGRIRNGGGWRSYISRRSSTQIRLVLGLSEGVKGIISVQLLAGALLYSWHSVICSCQACYGCNLYYLSQLIIISCGVAMSRHVNGSIVEDCCPVGMSSFPVWPYKLYQNVSWANMTSQDSDMFWAIARCPSKPHYLCSSKSALVFKPSFCLGLPCFSFLLFSGEERAFLAANKATNLHVTREEVGGRR